MLSDLCRFYLIIQICLSYGLDELIPQMRINLLLRIARHMLFWMHNKHKDKSLGERLRLSLQELGPVWIKFGQMLSTRRDIFSSLIIEQLSLLQDRVAPFDGILARQQIESSMGGSLEQWFEDFDQNALASASIAQVHTARLKENGQEIVIKVIRPDILPIIKADISLMYFLADWILKIREDGRLLRPHEVVREYEKTLLDELNLLHEASNMIKLRHNFTNSSMLYVPEIYSKFCYEKVLVTERIYGIPVSNLSALHAQNTNMKLLAERGVQIFFTQVFRDSFFHADMHPGNIFVSLEHPENPQYISIDCGIMGILSKDDKRYLAENFVAFFNRDYRKVAELHVASRWVPGNTKIEDFEFAIRRVCEPIFAKPLADISFGNVLYDLFNTARCFNMEVQPQLVMLQKTLLYIEGLGRQIYPQLDLWTTAKPFLEKWLKDHSGLSDMLLILKEKIPLWVEKIPELPELLYYNLQQNNSLKKNFDMIFTRLDQQRDRQVISCYLFGVSTTLLIIGITLLTSKVGVWPFWVMTIGCLIWIAGWCYGRQDNT
ncbi:ubiquinone biosynthesis regulatory protein kinase UbiB [Candidatus Profftia tarda]